MSLFCRHNRFTAECPICSRGTVLAPSPAARRRRPSAARTKKPAEAKRPTFSGPYVAGPARRAEDDVLVTVRLERVPGGVRLGEWAGAALRPTAPVLPAAELVELAGRAGEALDQRDAQALVEAVGQSRDDGREAAAGASRGRSGEFKDELRVEPLGDGAVRVARWVLRPGSGWDLIDAAPMLPASRYAEALADAARRGVLEAPPAASEPA